MVMPILSSVSFVSSQLGHVIISSVFFILVWQFLSKVFFKPFFDVLIEREKRTVGAEDVATKALRETEETEHIIEDTLKKARLEALKVRDERLLKAKSAGREIVDAAERESSEKILKAKSKINDSLDKSLSEAKAEAENLSAKIVKKVLLTSNQIH